MKVKICGLYREEDIAFVNLVKPEYVGFVFAKSKRQITREQAREYRKSLSRDIQVVGVFVNAQLQEIIDICKEGSIDLVQLHGGEAEEFVCFVKAMTGKPVIKAVEIHSKTDVEKVLYSEADYLLFDQGKGGGKTFDWSILPKINRPYFLAGGLDCKNVKDAITVLQPYAVDVSSGVEQEGKKDFDKMKEFVKVVRQERAI